MSTLRDTNVSTADEAAQADTLREAMIAELRELKAIRSDRVADAFHTVPRHLFAPGEPLEEVYAADSAVVTKRDEHGAAVGAVSSAHMQATMLEQAQLGSGMRVLEIGSGGYNAALTAELVGVTGEVTTVDIDPDVVDRALNKLADQGLVTVVEEGARGRRTYDLTADGRAELRRWLQDTPESGFVRHEYVLRMFLLNTLEPAEACAVLEQFAETGEQEAKRLRDVRAQTPPESVLWFGQLAAEFGLRYFQMQRDWARCAIEQLKLTEQTRGEQPEQQQSRNDAVATS